CFNISSCLSENDDPDTQTPILQLGYIVSTCNTDFSDSNNITLPVLFISFLFIFNHYKTLPLGCLFTTPPCLIALYFILLSTTSCFNFLHFTPKILFSTYYYVNIIISQ